MKVTKTESEILRLLNRDFLTPKQIAHRRKTTVRYVYKVIQNLKKKGLYFPKETTVHFSQCTPKRFKNLSAKIRLHGQEFNIKLIYGSLHYNTIKNKGNLIVEDNNLVRLYRNSIEIYGGREFFGETAREATAKSMEYWQKFLYRLQEKLKVTLIKPRVHNIRLVKSHYAEWDNELAKYCNAKEEKIKVKATEDGKVWFTIDRSLSIDEAETIHPETAKQDMQDIITPIFNEWRDKKVPVPKEAYLMLTETIKNQKEQSENLVQISYSLRAILEIMTANQPLPKKDIKESKAPRPDYVG